ncbi:hypothetical protein [Vibrio phage LP.1]|nr:hypothetical protein [Vibrio phage LP.1]
MKPCTHNWTRILTPTLSICAHCGRLVHRSRRVH